MSIIIFNFFLRLCNFWRMDFSFFKLKVTFTADKTLNIGVLRPCSVQHTQGFWLQPCSHFLSFSVVPILTLNLSIYHCDCDLWPQRQLFNNSCLVSLLVDFYFSKFSSVLWECQLPLLIKIQCFGGLTTPVLHTSRFFVMAMWVNSSAASTWIL